MTIPTGAMPRHPRTGLAAVGIVAGRPVWPILGGSGGSGTTDDQQQGQQQGGTSGDGQQGQQGQQQSGDTGSQGTSQSSGQGQQGGQQDGQSNKPGPAQLPAGFPTTQDQLDKLIKGRLDQAQQSWQKGLAQALGLEKGDDPAKALEAAQQSAAASQTRADRAEARSLALAAGVKPDRVDRFVRLVDIPGALANVDRSKGDDAVSAAIKAAVEAELESTPEFKGAAPVPDRSGGDRQGDSGKPTFTRAQIVAMSQDELAKNVDAINEALAAGRVT